MHWETLGKTFELQTAEMFMLPVCRIIHKTLRREKHRKAKSEEIQSTAVGYETLT